MDCSCSSHGSFLTAKGIEDAEQRRAGPVIFPGVDMHQLSLYLDKVGSVSGLRRDETDHVFDDAIVDEQYRRFLSVDGDM